MPNLLHDSQQTGHGQLVKPLSHSAAQPVSQHRGCLTEIATTPPAVHQSTGLPRTSPLVWRTGPTPGCQVFLLTDLPLVPSKCGILFFSFCFCCIVSRRISQHIIDSFYNSLLMISMIFRTWSVTSRRLPRGPQGGTSAIQLEGSAEGCSVALGRLMAWNSGGWSAQRPGV